METKAWGFSQGLFEATYARSMQRVYFRVFFLGRVVGDFFLLVPRFSGPVILWSSGPFQILYFAAFEMLPDQQML